MATPTAGINVSLEPHLVEALKPVYGLLPQKVAQDLQPYVSDSPPALVPYDTLLSVAKWARTDEGQRKLKRNGLNASDYNMVALLAGATTSPERKFGTYVPPKDPEEVQRERLRERKAITALLNSVLSVGCVGFAAWWAGGRQGWQQEWVSYADARRAADPDFFCTSARFSLCSPRSSLPSPKQGSTSF